MQLRCKCVVTHLESSGSVDPEARFVLKHCPWIDAFQVGIWETLGDPGGAYPLP
ncbi:MAG: hypothetical protein J0M24_00480 [Verrucomicrobia bacterium]|nr:hypothetical protein [Verrucomicrobiota bacterium]